MGQFAASFYRHDLLANGIGDGRYAFRAYVPGQLSTTELDRFEVFTSFPRRITLSHRGKTQHLADDARAGARTIARCAREMFRPLLVQLASAIPEMLDGAGPGTDCGTDRRLYEHLLGPSPIKGTAPLHGHTLSAYTDHIRHKYELAEVYNTSFSKSEYDGFLKWYLESYGETRRAKRAPLSAHEIAYLNAVVGADSPGSHMTRAASLFVEDHFGRSPKRNLSADELAYWWSVEQSRKLFVEDCLVPQENVRLLERVRDDVGEYPLSIFMEMFISKNSIFDNLSTDRVDVRRMIYFVIMLYAIRIPHILSFLPLRWLELILARRARHESCFDELAALVFGKTDLITSHSYTGHLKRMGFDLHQQKFSFFARDGSRILAAGLGKPDRAVTDIQIIGPFRRTLGLSHSCRLLGKLIGTLGYKVNCVDFDLENHSPDEDFDLHGLDKLSPARINILHLNPEALPAVIAYSPDVFSNAYNIAFCYWELDFPGDCQLLGLKLPDEIWTASTFVADVFRAYCRSVVCVGMASDFSPTRNRDDDRTILTKYGIAEGDFVFLTVSDALSRVERKNPFGAIRAFLAAFPTRRGVKLIIKTHNLRHVTDPDQRKMWKAVEEVATGDDRIILIDETLSREQHCALIAASDCLVSLHRSEGFGLDLIYALRCGVALMATGYSGNLDFCNRDSVWLIDYEKRYLKQSDYAFVKPGHRWAEPDHDNAVATMREILADAPGRKRLSDNGRRFVAEHFSVEAISRRIDLRIKEILYGQHRPGAMTVDQKSLKVG